MKNLGGLWKCSFLFVSVAVLLVLAACGSDKEGNAQTGEEVSETTVTNAGEEVTETESVKIVLNWFAQAGHGGIYTADGQGFFQDNGLEVTIEPGGPQISSVQMVASGSAQFGLVHGDQLLMAKNQGIDLVALATIYQNSPQAMMTHKGHEIEDFGDINGRTAFIQPGIAYWEYFKGKYELSDVNELAFTGDHSNFINDEESVNQVYVTGEPFFMEQQGIETETKLISESGYNPYQYVLYVTKDYLAENEETVEKFVSAFVEGWNYFRETPDETLEAIHEMNPDKSMEAFEYEMEVGKDFIYVDDAEDKGFGYMSEERWSALIDQLTEAGVLEVDIEAADIFTNDYLPGS
ncbi:ABC transporter substrate-binding protein [Gracilibacillus caseinilyticus]|uniref:Thiamine pyrimidine synthase n=1 Tax=Gracilibacillus caseinilyticus TaxID=2932256 RepID=A0ABY4ERS4_9BACI|nr:ABC transporter substrate-binding protein [Gracilibacillus caseinilyticus]UOQ46602.1 ABC transporter substrate-binding protein [Gracilibacillus caseinilyticus]